MPLLDTLKIYRDDLRPLLADDEEPLAMAAVSLAFGARRTDRPSGDTRDRDRSSGRRSVLDRLAGVIDPAWRWNDVDFDQVIGGVTVSGRAGSWAHRLAAAVDEAPGTYVVVTDRRLFVLRRPGDQGRAVAFEVPLQAIAGARRRGRGYSRGRVVVEFADSSTLALHAGFVDAGRADGLVRALDQQGGRSS